MEVYRTVLLIHLSHMGTQAHDLCIFPHEWGCKEAHCQAVCARHHGVGLCRLLPRSADNLFQVCAVLSLLWWWWWWCGWLVGCWLLWLLLGIIMMAASGTYIDLLMPPPSPYWPPSRPSHTFESQVPLRRLREEVQHDQSPHDLVHRPLLFPRIRLACTGRHRP